MGKLKKEQSFIVQLQPTLNQIIPANYQTGDKWDKREYNKAYMVEHKEKIVIYQKGYRAEHKDKFVIYQKVYRDKNKEELSEYKKAYRVKNKEAISSNSKAYWIENKETIKEFVVFIHIQAQSRVGSIRPPRLFGTIFGTIFTLGEME